MPEIPDEIKTLEPKEPVANTPFPFNPMPGYEWTDRWNSRKRIDTNVGELNKRRPPPPGLSPPDPHMQMEGYDNLNTVERWMGRGMPTGLGFTVGDVVGGIQKGIDYLPSPVQKGVYAVGETIFKALSVFDAAGEFVERGSGFVRQWKLAAENDDIESFQNNLGDAWAAGSLFYDVSNTPIFKDGKLSYHFELPGTTELPILREKITALTDGGMERKEALEQVRTEYMSSIGAMSLRAAKQDMIGHVLIDPFMWLTLGGYAPVDIIQKTSTLASKTKMPAEWLEWAADAARIAEKNGDLAKATEITAEIAKVKKTHKVINAGDRAAMFITGQFPEPIAGYSKKIDDILYYAGNTLAGAETGAGKAWRKINPFSLTPAARADDWLTRISDYIGTDVLSRGDPYEITETLKKLANQATSGRVSAMGASPDGRMIQSYLRASDINAEQLLNDFRIVADDGAILVRLAKKLDSTTPDLIKGILDGKGDDIIKQLSRLDDEGAMIAASLTDDVMTRLGKLKGTPYSETLFRHILHDKILDDVARLGIVKFGIEQQGFIQKWTAFMKAGESLAFLRANPTFAFRNWINNEVTLIRDLSGFGFKRQEDLAELVGKLGFGPLKANQAWTMAGMTGGELGDIGANASKIIAQQLQGDATALTKAAKWIQNRELGPFDFGKLALKMEQSASRRALVAGYNRHWRQMWKPGGFTSASKILPQNVIRELGEGAVHQLDDLVQNAGSIADLDNIFNNLSKIDLNKSVASVENAVAKNLGITLEDQFGAGAEYIRKEIERAIDTGDVRQAEKIYDDLFRQHIDEITKESEAALTAKAELFEQATESQRSMALLDLTEEATNQLDIANYTYSVGMTRFRPMDVSKEVRDAYWPIWLKQQNTHFDNMWNRIDAAIEGVRKGGKNIDLNLDQALGGFKKQKKNWSDFFTWRNEQYALSKEQGWANWDELVIDIDKRYIKASNIDLSFQQKMDDLMEATIRVNNPELADGFAGWRKLLREWKQTDRALTRSYTHAQKTGELPVDGMTYNEFWKQRGGLYQEWGELKQRGYAMMEGDADELAKFSGVAPTGQAGKVAPTSRVGEVDVPLSKSELDKLVKRHEFGGTGWQTIIEEAARDNISVEDALELAIKKYGLSDLSPKDIVDAAYARVPAPSLSAHPQSGIGFHEMIDWDAPVEEQWEMLRRAMIANDLSARMPVDEITGELTRLSQRQIDEISTTESFHLLSEFDRIAPNFGEGTLGIYNLNPFDLLPEKPAVNQKLITALAKDLDGKQTTMRFMQSAESEMRPNFINESKEEHWFSRGFFTLRELEEETMKSIKSPVSRLDMSDFSKAELHKYFTSAKREMADAQYVALRMGEYTRDSALLNYRRRMNYDTWLGTLMPYEFWMTHSMGKWAIQSINRPAMTAFYYRTRQLQDRIGIDDGSFPTRLKGKMRIKVPPWLGMQDWMGDSLYFDPLDIAMPLGTMMMPFKMAKQQALSREGAVERELNRMVFDGNITQEEADEAFETHAGPIFQEAMSLTEETGNQTDNYELLSALSSVHAPYDFAYKGLTGQLEEIGPFLPATFTVTRLLGMFGVDAPHEKMNAAARMRRKFGLPGFDQWEDYRVERMLANLSATGDITPDEAARAMIAHEGPAWELARKRSAKEYAGGPWWSTILKTLGAPTYIYPEGEYLQRELGKEFGKAAEAYDNGDFEAYNKFFDENPEFSNRLSLWDEPVDRMRNFLVDDVWNMYSEMPSINKKIVRETLGEDFALRFLDKNTRNYEAIPIEQLQMWAKMMGGDPPGTLSEAFPIDLAPPEIANQAQMFYDIRNQNFPNYYELQNEYFDLAEGARRNYLQQNPVLAQYWGWRRDFLKRNPSIAAYIDDDFEPKYSTVEEMREAKQTEPTFTRMEYTNRLGAEAVRIITSVYKDELRLPEDILEYLHSQAERLGMTYEEMVEKIGTSR